MTDKEALETLERLQESLHLRQQEFRDMVTILEYLVIASQKVEKLITQLKEREAI